MEIRICDKCKGTNVTTLVPRIQEIYPEAEIKIGCQHFCGIGATKSFAIKDGIPIITDTEDELVEKLKNEWVITSFS